MRCHQFLVCCTLSAERSSASICSDRKLLLYPDAPVLQRCCDKALRRIMKQFLSEPSTVVFDENGQYVDQVSFIVCLDSTEEGKAVVSYVSRSINEVLGWDPEGIIGWSADAFCHPDEVENLYKVYQEAIDECKAACLMFVRVPFNDSSRGHLLCSATITRVGRHFVGAVSPAAFGTNTIRTMSTASEVINIIPSLSDLVTGRWNVHRRMVHLSARPSNSETQSSEAGVYAQNSHGCTTSETAWDDDDTHLAKGLTLHQPLNANAEHRVAFVLDTSCNTLPIVYCTSGGIVPETLALNRPFYDFVAPVDEGRIRRAIEASSGWARNEYGTPVEGGFLFTSFNMCLQGRGPRASQSVNKWICGPGRGPVAASSESVSANSSTLVDAIFSPQSDGIIVILRPAL